MKGVYVSDFDVYYNDIFEVDLSLISFVVVPTTRKMVSFVPTTYLFIWFVRQQALQIYERISSWR